MKRLVSLFCLSLFVIPLCSQSYYQQFRYKDGVVVNYINNTDFAVYSFKGQTKEQLYQRFLVAISEAVEDFNKDGTRVENEIITVNTYLKATQLGLATYKGVKLGCSGLQAKFSFKFKDEKVRFDAPQILKVDLYELAEDRPRRYKADYKDITDAYIIDIIIENFLKKVYKASVKKEDDW